MVELLDILDVVVVLARRNCGRLPLVLRVLRHRRHINGALNILVKEGLCWVSPGCDVFRNLQSGLFHGPRELKLGRYESKVTVGKPIANTKEAKMTSSDVASPC